MGCGLYDLLGWGVIDPPSQVDADGYIIDLDGIAPLGLHETDATGPPCLVVPLSVSHPVLQDSWALPPLPDWAPRVAPRRVRQLRPPTSFTISVAIQQRWWDAQAVYRQAGMALPNAYLVVLSDWD